MMYSKAYTKKSGTMYRNTMGFAKAIFSRVVNTTSPSGIASATLRE